MPVRRFVIYILAAYAAITARCPECVAADGDSAATVRAVIPRATTPPTIDGTLSVDEYVAALCTPVEYFHRDAANRAGQFYLLWDDHFYLLWDDHFYLLWDDHAFYVGLRTLDAKPYSPESPLWEGDAVEWYFDARRGAAFLSQTWPTEANAGAVHCFFTAMNQERLEPRFTLRPGYEQAIAKQGVEVAATRTATGLEVEFKLPWANFPQFTPRAGEVIGLDAELSYSDGGPRSYRSFVFGSPLSVQQPANLARVQLVDRLERSHWQKSAAVMMPIRVDAPWSQQGAPHVVGQIAMPPGRRAEVGRIVFCVSDLFGKSLGEFAADREVSLAAGGDFAIREAKWPTALASPGQYQVHAVVYDRQGKELARIAPRMTSVNMEPGY